MLQTSILYKCFFVCLFFLLFLHFLFIKESWERSWFSGKRAAQFFSSLIIIRNVSLAANHHIRMILEGSCDTEVTLWHHRKCYFFKHIKFWTVLIYLLHTVCNANQPCQLALQVIIWLNTYDPVWERMALDSIFPGRIT